MHSPASKAPTRDFETIIGPVAPLSCLPQVDDQCDRVDGSVQAHPAHPQSLQIAQDGHTSQTSWP